MEAACVSTSLWYTPTTPRHRECAVSSRTWRARALAARSHRRGRPGAAEASARPTSAIMPERAARTGRSRSGTLGGARLRRRRGRQFGRLAARAIDDARRGFAGAPELPAGRTPERGGVIAKLRTELAAALRCEQDPEAGAEHGAGQQAKHEAAARCVV